MVFHKTDGAVYGSGNITIDCDTTTQVVVDIILKDANTNEIYNRTNQAAKQGGPPIRKHTVIVDKTTMSCDANGDEYEIATGYCARDKGTVGDNWIWCKHIDSLNTDVHITFSAIDKIAVGSGSRGSRRKRGSEIPQMLNKDKSTMEKISDEYGTEIKKAVVMAVGVLVLLPMPIHPLWKMAILTTLSGFSGQALACEDIHVHEVLSSADAQVVWISLETGDCVQIQIKDTHQKVMMSLRPGKVVENFPIIEETFKTVVPDLEYTWSCPGVPRPCELGRADLVEVGVEAYGWADGCFQFGLGTVCTWINFTIPNEDDNVLYSIDVNTFGFGGVLNIGTDLRTEVEVEPIKTQEDFLERKSDWEIVGITEGTSILAKCYKFEGMGKNGWMTDPDEEGAKAAYLSTFRMKT